MKVLETGETRLIVHSSNPEETLKLGRCLGVLLRSGDVVCLVGELGSGKTVLAKGIALGLGVDPEEGARSPTFALVHEYAGRFPISHIDLYRLGRPEELVELGWEEYLYGNWVAVIEWAEKAEGLLPEERLTVVIAFEGENERRFSLSASGPRYQELLRELSSSLKDWRPEIGA